MSSDETDDDEPGVYNVRKQDWRSTKLAKMLARIDRRRPVVNKYGNNKPGTRARTRKRRTANAPESLRSASAGKPSNFYDEAWFASLDMKGKRDLEVKPPMEFLMEDVVS